nr:FtsX-like permease family protein [Cytophagales bacterium]
RKVAGATREQVILQFITEAVVFSLFSLVLAAGLLILLKIAFTGLWFNKFLNIGFSVSGLVLLIFIAFSVVIGLVAGMLPSLYLSAFNPIQTLKNMSGLRLYKRHTLRKVLLVVQFCVSLVFIISTVLLYSQLSFLLVQDYGFDKNNMVNIKLYKPENYQRFVQSIASHKNVLHTSASGLIPGTGLMQMAEQVKRADSPNDSLQISWMDTDAGFIPTWGVKLLAGRSLPELPDTTAERYVMVTQKTVTDLKYGSDRAAIGQKLLVGKNLVEIIGVVSDFQYQGLHRELTPVMLRNRPKEFGYVNVRIRANEPMATVAYLEKQWKKVNPTTKFEYEFLDQQLLGFQSALNDIAKILGFLSFLAVLISCLGLLGMAAYTAETRTKEIGIRKVLGASVPQIAVLLARSFLYLLLIAIVIATPIAYFVNNLWLEFFAYRVSLGPGILGMGVLIMVAISLLSVFSQTWRAARTNPVKSLRSE